MRYLEEQAADSAAHCDSIISKNEDFVFITMSRTASGSTQLLFIRFTYEQVFYGWTTEGLELKSRYGQEFSLLRMFQTGSGAHAASYPNGTGGRGKEAGARR
jgi:hypothetical protein